LRRFSSLFLVSALSFASSASAAIIFTDGLPTLTDTYNALNAGNFSVLSGNVDVLQGGGPYGSLCAGAATCIDLNGETAGSITSGGLALAAGTYTLTFTLNNAQRNVIGSTTVTLGSLFNQTYTDPAPGTVTQTITVLSATNVPLIFTSNVGDVAGDILSAVSLISVPLVTPAPEVSSILLMSLPLLVFGAAYRRRACGRV
jgi:hypothetical protein